MRSFSVVMRGYAYRQVDDLFARIDGTLGGGPATGNPVTAAELRAVRLSLSMRGYASGEVDAALSSALRELERRDS
ncbi:MAG: DivIVA domain-containing protein [Streptosporangiaceae bacterium]